MSQLTQDADAIIAEEKLDNSQSAHEEPPTEGEKGATNEEASESASDNQVDQKAEENTNQPKEEPKDAESGEAAPEEEQPKDEKAASESGGEETKAETPPDTKSSTETVEEAKGLIENLNLSEDQIIDPQGNIKPWEELVPAGAYLASQLEPIKVTDKEGKTHEFLLLSDVERDFPNGFEAKNNIEQMKFEMAIRDNEAKFKEAVGTYNEAKTRYTQETSAMVQAQSDNARIAKEYRAMADQGLVPKIEGDPNDPKFLESAAVKELNKILNWMDETNKTNKEKGLGQISSIYIAKQLMAADANKTERGDKAKEIDKERKEVASLTSSPAPSTKDNKPKAAPDIPMARFAEQIIASEGLK